MTGGKALVAPYYYTLSPVPIPKHAMMMTMQHTMQAQGAQGVAKAVAGGCKVRQGSLGAVPSSGPGGNGNGSGLVIPPYNPNGKNKQQQSQQQFQSFSAVASTLVGGAAGSGGTGVKCRSDPKGAQRNRLSQDGSSFEEEMEKGEILEVEINHHHHHDVYTASLELDAGADRLKEFVEKIRAEMEANRRTPRRDSSDEIDPEEDVHIIEDDSDDEEEEEEEEEDEEEDEDSDDDSTQEDEADGHFEGTHTQSHRSHEESSNDSGISDEMTEKSKTTLDSLSRSSDATQTSGGGSKAGAHQAQVEAEVKNVKIPSSHLQAEKEIGGVGGGVHGPLAKKGSSSCSTSSSTSVSSTKLNVAHNGSNQNPSLVVTNGSNHLPNKQSVVVVLSSQDVVSATSVYSATASSSCNNCSCAAASATVSCVEHSLSCVVDHSDKLDNSDKPAHFSEQTMSHTDHCDEDDVDDGRRDKAQITQTPLFRCQSDKGKTPGSVETMVVLADDNHSHAHQQQEATHQANVKVDKCTETKEEDFTFLRDLNADKPLKSILAQRREQFFSTPANSYSAATSGGSPSYNYQHSSVTIHPTCCRNHQYIASLQSQLCTNSNMANVTATAAPPSEPLIVKIVDGGTLQSTEPEKPNGPANDKQLLPAANCERVQLQRLERQKKAKVERVESSEDSTSSSSDLASASPGAAENGTTDPSWSSSSSSSLAGLGATEPCPQLLPQKLTRTTSVDVATSTTTVVTTEAVSVAETTVATVTFNLPGDGETTPVVVAAPVEVVEQLVLATNNGNSHAPYSNHRSLATITTQTSNSSSTSSKSYSLLLESDFSSFESTEPPSSFSTSGGSTSNAPSAKPVATTSSAILNKCVDNNNIETVSSSAPSSGGDNQQLNNEQSVCATTSGGPIKKASSMDSEIKRLIESSDELETSDKSTTDTTNTTSGGIRKGILKRGTSLGGGGGGLRVVVVEGGIGPEIAVTEESDEELEEDEDEEDSSSGDSRASTQSIRHGYSSDGEEDSIVCNGPGDKRGRSEGGTTTGDTSEGDSSINSNRSTNGSFKQKLGKGNFLRVESNDSTAEGEEEEEEDEEEFGAGFGDEEEDDLSHCSVATINRYGTFESLEKLESEDTVGELQGGGAGRGGMGMPRSKARFTFEDEDDDEEDEDLFEEDFETDFNFRFPSQIQDNTYSKWLHIFVFVGAFGGVVWWEILKPIASLVGKAFSVLSHFLFGESLQ